MISLGLDIWAQSDFFGPMKDAGIFLGCKKKRGIFLGCEKSSDFFVRPRLYTGSLG